MKEMHDMDVYRLSEELSDMIWHDYDTRPLKVQKTIGVQIITAVDSIAANLAEGFGRFHASERKVFYRYARGSFEETKCWLRKLIRRGIIPVKRVEDYKTLINELGPKLNAFIRATKSQGSSFKDQVSK